MKSTAFAFATKKYCSHYVNFDLRCPHAGLFSPFQCFLSHPCLWPGPPSSLLLFLFLCWPSLTFALDIRQTLTRLAFWRRSSRNVPAVGYVNPNDDGGSMLTVRTPPRGIVALALTGDVQKSPRDNIPRRAGRACQCYNIRQLRLGGACRPGDRRGVSEIISCAFTLSRLPADPKSRITCRSLSFSSECLGQHSGSDQQVDLGDGNGYRASDSCSAVFLVLIVASAVNETAVIRYNYGDPSTWCLHRDD